MEIAPTAENVSVTRIAQPSRVVSRPTCRRTFKVIVLGDPNVGKTCLSFRFCNGKFPSNTEATIGVDFREKVVELDGELLRVNRGSSCSYAIVSLQIQFWDTAGQERFRQSMVSHYYRNVHAIIFVYDVSQASSFRQLPHWIDECQKHGVFGTVPMLLVGNKCDVPTVQVSTDEAQRFADQHDMPLFITSAKDEAETDQITSIYMTLVHILQKNKPVHVTTDEERVRLKAHLEEQSSDYCGC